MEEASRSKPKQSGQLKKFSCRYSTEKQSLGTKFEVTTKLKQAEDASLIDEIPFKTLIDLAPVAISISRNGIGIYANLKFLNLFGLQSPAEYIGRQTYEFFAPQRQAEIKEFIRLRALGLPVPKEYEMIGLRTDGSQFPMQIVVDRVNLADGPANIAFATDISERRQAAEALRESEQRYRSIFEGVQDAVFVESLDGRILDANPCACKIFGYTRQQLLEMSVKELVPSEDKIVPFNLEESSTIPPHPVETVNVRAKGEEFPVELTIRLQDYNGEQVYYIVLRDISERKRAEVELSQSREQLLAFSQHLQAAREEERASIARKIHDELGQQLTALKMDLAWLTRHFLPEQVPLIQRAATMSEMIDSTIQTVRRVASELRPGILDDLGLAAALEWQAGEFQSRTGILCKLVLPREVVEIERDQATALFRIFQEALTNISRHSRASNVRIVLKVQADRIDFAIRDNGIGITDSQIRDLHSLGLTGMRERVHVFGGKLQFRNEAGKGTTVFVTMPLVKKKLEKEP